MTYVLTIFHPNLRFPEVLDIDIAAKLVGMGAISIHGGARPRRYPHDKVLAVYTISIHKVA